MVSARGFTLVELIVVMAIIGILASFTFAAINIPATLGKAHDAQRKTDLRNLQHALELYYNDFNKYPTQAQFTSFAPTYIQAMPQDPKAGQTYGYNQTQAGQAYVLYAALERCQPSTGCFDQQACKYPNASACDNAASNGLSCGGTCTYGVASSNQSL